MLNLTIPDRPGFEAWDEKNEKFVNVPPVKGATIQVEHSLISLSKWESKYHKSFLTNEEKTLEETIDYIKCMTLTQNVRPEVYEILTTENVKEINDYIGDSMTATTFREKEGKKRNQQRITSELVYYWMVALNIPFECQKWHLNRLLTLIRVCNEMNEEPKKMSQKDLYKHHAAVNAARRKKKP